MKALGLIFFVTIFLLALTPIGMFAWIVPAFIFFRLNKRQNKNWLKLYFIREKEMKESFRFFKTFLDTGKALPSSELQAQFFIALAEYALEGKEPDDPMLQALLVAPKFTLDKSESISLSASERGKLWGRPKKRFWTAQKAPKAKESSWKLSKATESEVEVEEVEEENKIKDKEIADAIEKSWLEEKVIDLYIDFLNQREANKIKNTLQATKQHLNLLLKQENEAIRLKILENSINNSWRWLFELNEKDLAKFRECEPPKPYQPPPQNDLDPILT